MRAALAAGVLLGLMSRVEERIPGFSLGISSNAGWIATAFAIGAAARAVRPGACRGMVALTVANATYYGVVFLTESVPLAAVAGRPSWWFLLGVSGGALFGAAGAVWRAGGEARRLAAGALCAGVLIADGAPALQGRRPADVLAVAAGTLLLVAGARSAAGRVAAAALALSLAVVASTGQFEPLMP